MVLQYYVGIFFLQLLGQALLVDYTCNKWQIWTEERVERQPCATSQGAILYYEIAQPCARKSQIDQ